MNNKSIRHMFCMGVIMTTFASASFAQVTLKASMISHSLLKVAPWNPPTTQ